MRKVSKNLAILAIVGACVGVVLLCMPKTPAEETVLNPDLTVAVRKWDTPNGVLLDVDIINTEKEAYTEVFIVCALLDKNGYALKKIATRIATKILPAFDKEPRVTRLSNVYFKPTKIAGFSAISCEAIGD